MKGKKRSCLFYGFIWITRISTEYILSPIAEEIYLYIVGLFLNFRNVHNMESVFPLSDMH